MQQRRECTCCIADSGSRFRTLARVQKLLMSARMMMKNLSLSFLVVLSLAACGSKKAATKGACVVDYDDLGDTGTACTVVPEPECKDDMMPAVTNLASSKKKAFTANKTCADIGYAKAGCRNVPIAWSFQPGTTCPGGE
jgi:hypothetical protein